MIAPSPSLAVVIPVFNEQQNIAAVTARTRAVLDGLGLRWTIIFVDDGSRDATAARIRQENAVDARIQALVLSRNFGKEIAMAAGLRAAQGDAVVLMDGDLQHPPETIARFHQAWREGAEVVFGHRSDAIHASFGRRLASSIFYPLFRALSRMPLESGAVDFVLLDSKAVEALNRVDEHTRFTKGLFHWIGFRTATVTFDAPERERGASSFGLRRLLTFALDGIITFSSLPLRIWSGIGAAISASSILYALYFAVRTMFFGADVPGFPSLIVSITLLSGIQLFSLGVIGEYLARIYEEVKGRPLYIIREKVGFDLPTVTAPSKAA